LRSPQLLIGEICGSREEKTLNESQTEQPLNEQQEATLRIHELAQKIKDEKQLRAILMTAILGLRHKVYKQLLPHLNFKPREYRKLMRNA
jgi:hypothetical protein